MNPNPNDLPHNVLESVKNAIEKGRLVENLVRHQGGRQSEVVESLVHRQQTAQLDKVLRQLHPADLARVIEKLSPEDRQLVWLLQAPRRGGAILMELSDSVAEQVMLTTDELLMNVVLQQLDADDLGYMADIIPQDLLQKRLNELSRSEQEWINDSLQYGPDSVGALMSKDMVVISEASSISSILAKIRRMKQLPAQNDKFFVTDLRGHLSGILPWQTLLMAEPEDRVRDVMVQAVVTFSIDESANDAARAFERYNLVSAPVLNQRGRPIGRLTVDEVIDFVRDEISEDALNSAGLNKEEDLFAPVWNSARNRWLWLALSLLTAFVASRVIGLFEETIAKFVALAALMPIVAAIGGNTGNQTTTLVVRGLALDQIDNSNVRQLVRKEMTLSLLNGAVWGSLVGLFALVFYHNLLLSGVIALAMVLTLILAAVLGLAVPLTLQKMERDPALGSGVLVTALTDSMGFFIFLGLASVIL